MIISITQLLYSHHLRICCALTITTLPTKPEASGILGLIPHVSGLRAKAESAREEEFLAVVVAQEEVEAEAAVVVAAPAVVLFVSGR